MFARIDRAKPAAPRVPPNLLIPTASVELRDGNLVVKATAKVGPRERDFFDRYQRDFSWSAGVRDELWQDQLAWSQLPLPIQDYLREIGTIRDGKFEAPSEPACLRRYLATRQITYLGTTVLMPVMELSNHGGAMGFGFVDGVSAGGLFDDEFLVNYSSDDCWGRAADGGFCAPQHYALSLKLSLTFEDHAIEIDRAFEETERLNDFPLPIVRVQGNVIRLTFMLLGNTRMPRMPRASFLHVMRGTPIRRPDELYEIIQHGNVLKLVKFLRLSEGHATPLVATLRQAAYQQLETLSYHWGTRPLENATGRPTSPQPSAPGAEREGPARAGG